jgi:isopentenyl diphosphate isomerase/L-lactate dehydrogenase-like FMN-dependent dehydrogenase
MVHLSKGRCATRGARRPFFILGTVKPVNVADYEALAAQKLEPGAHGYYAGGANDELTLRANVDAYRCWQLRPRVLVDVAEPSTNVRVLGQDIAFPVIVAPVAFQRVAHPDGEVAMARAAKAAGTIMCLSTLATATLQEIEATGAARWFQFYVPKDDGLARSIVDQARECGFSALILTADTPVLGRRERDHRSGFTIPSELAIAAIDHADVTPLSAFGKMSASLTWPDVERLSSLSGLPVIVKGVLTAEDARLACEHGAAAVVVSNHGGRQLDGVAATIDVLPEVVDAVDGRIEVLVDGGVRRGTDVVKALALGARAVLAGRAPLWGLVVDGEAGVRDVLELLRAEVELALQLTGCRTPAEVTRAHVARGS